MTRIRRVLTRVFIGAMSWCGVGCRFETLATDLEHQEDLIRVEGRVEGIGEFPVVVVVARQARTLALLDRAEVDPDGSFSFVIETRHPLRLVAFEDRNRNLEYDPGERLATSPEAIDPALVRIGRPRRVSVTLTLHDAHASPVLADALELTGERRSLHVGAVVSLDDPRFDSEVAIDGVWEPLRFMTEFGAGLFLTEEWRPGATPVFFVHGYGGSPRELAPMLDTLPPDAQPVFAHYPSGWRLDEVADYFERLVSELRYTRGFERACFVTHSMGGLVTRAMFNQSVRRERDPLDVVWVSIGAPFGGLRSAASGVNLLSTVVPSWRDIAVESEFLEHLFDTDLPNVRHVLVFSYDDETVPLISQLRPEAQERAVDMLGVYSGHVASLSHPAVLARVRRELESCVSGTSD